MDKLKGKNPKKKIKGNKDDNYTNLLKKIDIDLDIKNDPLDSVLKSPEETFSNEDNGLKLSDLLTNLEQKNFKISKIKQQYSDLHSKGHKIQEAASTRLQDQAERKANYNMIVKDMKKWQPIIKKNRETEHLDLTQNTKTNSKRINSIELKPLSNNEFTTKIENKVKELNVENEGMFKKQEEKMKEGNSQLNVSEIMKHKNLMFYQELKQKRLSKIKSKLYHKLKNKKLRQQKLNNQNLDPSFQANEIERMTAQRAEERLSLRHKMKSKYVKNLIRYGGNNKKDIKDSINEANQIRAELLKKIHEDPEVENGYSEEENEQDFKDKMVQELEKEFLKEGNEEENEKKAKGLKFLDKFVEKREGAIKNEAAKLLKRLKESKNFDEISVSSDEKEKEDKNDSEMEEEDQENNKKKEPKNKTEENEENFEGRKKFIKANDEKNEKEKGYDLSKEMSAAKVLNKFINKNDAQENVKTSEIIEEKINLNEDLTQGINLGKLKTKYNKKINVESQINNLENAAEEDLQNIYQNITFNHTADNKNEGDFYQEKIDDMEIKEDTKEDKLKGWGSWAGFGIEQKKTSPEEKLKRKKLEIERIKKTRRDGNLNSVIINEKRNKNISKYLVSELPVPFKSKEQFNFLNNMPLGSEWNTMTTHQNLIKPDIKNKKGEIIEPIKFSKVKFSRKTDKN